MKQIALYTILFAYCMVMLKPVTPYITDTIAHIFYKAKHIATVHYENGKYHVHKEVTATAKKDAAQNQVPAAKKDNSTVEHIFLTQTVKFLPGPYKINYPALVTPHLISSHPATELPPPRA